MTRFARADGSKSSNKRVPDDATPWNQLKNSTATPPTSRKITWKRSADDAGNVADLEHSEDSAEVRVPKKKRKEYKRRKELTDIPSIYKEGKEVGIVRFEGFPVRKDDADRLKALKKKLLASKVPHNEIKKTMKLERRRAEKALAREKKKLCFHCRNSGHVLSECPELRQSSDQLPESGICFKCGSTEHQHTQCKVVRGDTYKYATCFICKEEGHISKQCPDNPKGMYPEGGSCRKCGDVTHLKKDCPKLARQKKEEFEVTVKTLNSRTLEALDEDEDTLTDVDPPKPKKKKKIVRM